MTHTPPPDQPKMPALPKTVNPETLHRYAAEAEEYDKAEKATLDAATGTSESKKKVLDSVPQVKMEIRVAKFLANVLTKRERWKKMRFGFLVAPLTVIVGLIVLIAGIIAIPAPGPGWLIVFMGLGILSMEVPPARALVLLTARFFDRCENWFRKLPQPVQVLVTTVGTIIVVAIIFALYHFMGPKGWPLTRG